MCLSVSFLPVFKASAGAPVAPSVGAAVAAFSMALAAPVAVPSRSIAKLRFFLESGHLAVFDVTADGTLGLSSADTFHQTAAE